MPGTSKALERPLSQFPGVKRTSGKYETYTLSAFGKS